jgi:Ca2+-binding EF-hand superfamily protein
MNNSAGSSFRLGTVLAILFPIGILLSVGFLAWGYLDIPGKIARMGRPPLVLVKGKVIFEGKPLAGATLETKMENGSAEGAIAFTNDDGNFVFQTDVTEGRANGAFAGKHKITIKRFDHTAPVSAGAPPLMTPADYSDFDKTPLTVEITAESAKSPLELVIEGKARYMRPELADKPRAPAEGPAQVDKEKLAAAAAEVLAKYDKDGDNMLSKEELAAMTEPYKALLEQSDYTKDGMIDASEIEPVLRTEVFGGPQTRGSVTGGGGGRGGPGGGGGRGGPGGGGGGGGGFDPAQIFARLDTDSDGKLSAEEIEAVPEQWRGGVKERDKNGDGFVDKDEFMAQRQGGAGNAPNGDSQSDGESKPAAGTTPETPASPEKPAGDEKPAVDAKPPQ